MGAGKEFVEDLDADARRVLRPRLRQLQLHARAAQASPTFPRPSSLPLPTHFRPEDSDSVAAMRRRRSMIKRYSSLVDEKGCLGVLH